MTYKCSKSSNVALTFKSSLIISDIDAIKHFLQMIHGLHHKIDGCRRSFKIILLFITSYHCEEVLILHNKPHPPPLIVTNDTIVSRCNGCCSWQKLEVVTKPLPVCKRCGGGDTRNLHGKGGENFKLHNYLEV